LWAGWRFARQLTQFREDEFTTCLAATDEMGPENQLRWPIMLAASIFRRLRTAAARFGGANQGNVAVIFAIAILPVMGFAGAAIDYSRANAARSSMQAALDSTALMMSKDLSSGTFTLSGTPAQQSTQLNAKALAYFTGLYTNSDAKAGSAPAVPVINAIYTPTTSTGSTILITGAGTIQTDFMKVLNIIVPGQDFSTMKFSANSTTTWGNVKMRVALALDNTGSMADNNKISALRNAVAASGGLIDQLSALAQNPGDVYISVIPFAKVVNVGTANSSATWIDWTDWLNPPTTQPANAVGSPSKQANLPGNWHGIGPGMSCPFTNSNDGFTCTSSPANGDSNVSTIPSSGTYKGYICPSVDYNSHTLYNGCWDSELVSDASPQAFCTGPSNKCFCPSGSSSSCNCTHSGSVYTCTGPRYIHNWTQPAPSDTTHNTSQPHIANLQVGFNYNDTSGHVPTTANPNPNPYWVSGATTCANPTSSLNCMTPAYNNWKQASTNPISNWTGCITDRFQNYDETSDAPNPLVPATLFPANEYYENNIAYCNSSSNPTLEPIIPMTYTWASLKTAVNAMQPTGGTNQSVGLAWAWQSLLTTGPSPILAPAEDPNTTYNRVIIILSDGLNTEDRWPNYGNGSTQNTNSSGAGDIDVRQAQQCANIKAAMDSNGKPKFTVYTIQVNTSSPADPVSTVLQNCATDPTKFFMLTSSTQIATTFTTIGTALSQLRVSN
jgi:Flp pilus assembly protein TadG